MTPRRAEVHGEGAVSVRWSDGAPFTARDVVFTFDLLRRHPALDLRGVWAFVDDVRAPDDSTVEIVFSRVFIPGFFYLAQQPIVPEHIWKDVPDPVSWPNPDPVATGPLVLEVGRRSVRQDCGDFHNAIVA